MVRVGRFSEKTAVIYQHSDERQREVAAGLDDLVRAERNTTKTIPTSSSHHNERVAES